MSDAEDADREDFPIEPLVLDEGEFLKQILAGLPFLLAGFGLGYAASRAAAARRRRAQQRRVALRRPFRG